MITMTTATDGFNPLQIGSSVLISLLVAEEEVPKACFNPLQIGSSVLIHFN